MQKRKKILILLFTSTLIFFGLMLIFQPRETKEEEEVVLRPVGEIIHAHLFQAGADYELGKRREGEEVKLFKKGDYFGASARIEVEEKVIVSAEILNENKVIIDEKPMLPFEKEESGSLGLCCALVPEEKGEYYLRFKINGVEKNLSFKVIE